MGEDTVQLKAGGNKVQGQFGEGVLPEPMVDYLKWNHKAWGSEGSGGGEGSEDGSGCEIDGQEEVEKFELEPAFWETVEALGMPGGEAQDEPLTEAQETRLAQLDRLEVGLPVTDEVPDGSEPKLQLALSLQPTREEIRARRAQGLGW
jgi:hypothetical protein